MRPTPLPLLAPLGLMAVLALAAAPAHAADTPEKLLADYSAQARAPASAERGRKFFTTNFEKEMGWSCASCHTDTPAKPGKDQVSEKPIEPMAPAANPKRFTDKGRVESKFRLNCKDVVGRECSAGEKADVLAWLLSLKP